MRLRRGRHAGGPAADFVPWYNAHPDFTDVAVDLDTDTAVVIGAGNVAMDVARMLAIDPAELDPTDTADYALATIKLIPLAL